MSIRIDKTKIIGGYWILIYAAILVFFYCIHPLILFDTDDWQYSHQVRNMIPQISAWNPARVLPEILMPLVSYISGYLFYPIMQNFVMSLALGYAMVLSLFIVSYFYLAYRLLRQRGEFKDFQAMALTTLFIILHFLVYRIGYSDNEHAFYSFNITCYFFYIIPTLLNVILILYFELQGRVFIKDCHLRNGGVLLLIYLAIYSNLFNSCLLPIWCGVKCLTRWMREKRISQEVLRESAGYILVIAMWLISMVYELSGGRADSLENRFTATYLLECANTFVRRYHDLNHLIAMMIVLCLIFHVSQALRGKKEYIEPVLQLVAIYVIAGVYLVLLCARVNAWYLNSTTYINTTLVLMLFIYYSIGSCIQEYPQINVLIPLVIGMLFFNINTNGDTNHTFKDSNLINNATYAYKCSTYLVNSIRDADEAGITELEIHIPKLNDGDNWPLATYGGNNFSTSLYQHGIIGSRIDVTLIADENVSFADLR